MALVVLKAALSLGGSVVLVSGRLATAPIWSMQARRVSVVGRIIVNNKWRMICHGHVSFRRAQSQVEPTWNPSHYKQVPKRLFCGYEYWWIVRHVWRQHKNLVLAKSGTDLAYGIAIFVTTRVLHFRLTVFFHAPEMYVYCMYYSCTRTTVFISLTDP